MFYLFTAFLHSERYYALNISSVRSIWLRVSSYSITGIGEPVSKSLGGVLLIYLLVLATALGGCLVSSSESSAESLMSLIVLGESFPEPEQESAEGHSFGRSFILA